jgi:hypothetical protein
MYGLPRFLLVAAGIGIQHIIHRMLKRMDCFILSRANLWDSFGQNSISRVSFKLCDILKMDWNYDHASIYYINSLKLKVSVCLIVFIFSKSITFIATFVEFNLIQLNYIRKKILCIFIDCIFF